jgi:ribosomal protein L23
MKKTQHPVTAIKVGTRVLQYPITTEKAVGMIERENKMLFVVDSRVNRKQVKEAVEKTYNVKVEKVNIMNAIDGRKKAFVKLAKGYSADDIAAKLKIA